MRDELLSMRVRTIGQPFAWGIFSGFKWYETSDRITNIRGRIWIHAAKETPAPLLLHFLSEISKTSHAQAWDREWVRSLPAGGILGSVELVGCVPAEQIAGTLTQTERAFGDFSAGRWAWKLANPVLLPEPVHVRGKQGWWRWPEETEP